MLCRSSCCVHIAHIKNTHGVFFVGYTEVMEMQRLSVVMRLTVGRVLLMFVEIVRLVVDKQNL